MIFRFRITYEEHEEVYRDIDIRPTHSFEEFHTAIQKAIAFDNSKSATFYLSDDYWRKEKEIVSINKSKGKLKSTSDSIKTKNIADYINGPHQKFIYVFDPEKEWTFTIELTKILNDEKKDYPLCSKTVGSAPKQYKIATLPTPPVEDEKTNEEPDDYINTAVEENETMKDDEAEVVPSAEEMDAEEGVESEDNPKDDEEGESSDGLTFDFDDEDLV